MAPGLRRAAIPNRHDSPATGGADSATYGKRPAARLCDNTVRPRSHARHRARRRVDLAFAYDVVTDINTVISTADDFLPAIFWAESTR